jgi:hypothetical protein
MSESEGPYVIEQGEVWFIHTGPSTPGGKTMRLDRRHVCGPSESLALAFDDEDGTLLKHGTEAAVRKWHDGFSARMASAGEHAFPPPIVLTFPPNGETVIELNRCIAVTGRVKRLYDELTAAGKPSLP